MSRSFVLLALFAVLFAVSLAAEQTQQHQAELDGAVGDNTHIRERRWPGMWGMGYGMRPWGMGYGMGMYGMGYPMMGYGWGR